MKKFGIVSNKHNDIDNKYANILIDLLKKAGGEIVFYKIITSTSLDEKIINELSLLDNCECLISLGGDGTFLRAAREVYKYSIPLLGINLGSLGFLTEVEKDSISEAVDCLINDNYHIEQRIMFDVDVIRDGKIIFSDRALNDVVVARGALSRILHLETYISGQYVDTFPGDGIIVSTPTGSTAYSLSAGGPIVEPDTDLIIVTPICSHILYSRSFVTKGDREVGINITNNYTHKCMVTADGQQGCEVSGGDKIKVRMSKYQVKIITIKKRDFFNVLRQKIYFRGESISSEK